LGSNVAFSPFFKEVRICLKNLEKLEYCSQQPDNEQNDTYNQCNMNQPTDTFEEDKSQQP